MPSASFLVQKCQMDGHFTSKVNHINKCESMQDELEYLQKQETDYSDDEVYTLMHMTLDTSTSAT